jgi:tripartite-type tricarboxylate transporter receptor subunit TctC
MFKRTAVIFLTFIYFTTNLFAAEVNFQGKTVRWLIPFAVGGGSDKWARYYGPLLSQNLPGKPNVIIENCPGGGSITCANQFAAMPAGDGLTILGDSGSTKFPFLLEDPRVKYNYNDWLKTVVLVSPTGGVTYVSPSTGYKTTADFQKLKTADLKFGSQGATSLDLIPMIAYEILGLKVKHVFGMTGRGDGRLAFERGDANLDYQTSSAYLKVEETLIKEGKAIPLFSWGIVNPDGSISRDPTFPKLPHFAEYYEQVYKKNPSGPAFDAYKAFLGSGFSAQKMVFLPKGTSPEIVKAYRDTFTKIVNSPEHKASDNEEIGKYIQVSGVNSEAVLKNTIAVNAPAKKWLKQYLSDNYQVKF